MKYSWKWRATFSFWFVSSSFSRFVNPPFQAFDVKHKFECVIISVLVTLSFYFALSTFHAFKSAHTEHLFYLLVPSQVYALVFDCEDNLEWAVFSFHSTASLTRSRSITRPVIFSFSSLWVTSQWMQWRVPWNRKFVLPDLISRLLWLRSGH